VYTEWAYKNNDVQHAMVSRANAVLPRIIGHWSKLREEVKLT